MKLLGKYKTFPLFYLRYRIPFDLRVGALTLIISKIPILIPRTLTEGSFVLKMMYMFTFKLTISTITPVTVKLTLGIRKVVESLRHKTYALYTIIHGLNACIVSVDQGKLKRRNASICTWERQSES